MAATVTKGTIVLTGANGGLGSAIAQQIAFTPEYASYHGIYTVRNSTTTSVFDSSTAHSHDVVSLDLSDLDSVRRTAEAINIRVSTGQIPPIRALILNAGFMGFSKQFWNKDGLDVTFCVNYLGHWLLTLLLLKSMDKESGRIILISSQAHDPHDERNDQTKAFVDKKYQKILPDRATFEAIAKGIWSSAHEDPSWRSGYRRYGASKLFLLMMMFELQQRMDQDPSLKNICILGVDPGTMSTGIQRHAPLIVRLVLFRIIVPLRAWWSPDGPVRTTQTSAMHVLRAAFGRDGALGAFPKAKYFYGKEVFETCGEANDAQEREWVWQESVRYTQLKEDETVLSIR
ncbi:hypothetical protein HYFRA_00011868 [Hymenoscyphus fraxineus]|uniref:Short-chain dehydrogenase n=1 Tax=Hymenoscyphus fraxineus TaxID=746836 RepID=A0A9N9KYB1_9HELO|nr:hypothetical protein HYFRA_00011868 [Hymenoscyphus fraxineus]